MQKLRVQFHPNYGSKEATPTTYYCETWKGVYKYLLENKNWILPCYGNFLKTVKTFASYLVILINKTVMYNYMEFMIRPDRVSFVDSTSLPVCIP